MIHVSRSMPAPTALSEKRRGSTLTETEQAILHFSNPATCGQPFDFVAYRHPEVKEQLIKLFHGKCAYCESRIRFPEIMDAEGKAKSMDIEHWRPKGEIDLGGGQTLRGYYWLAAEWTNLLPSCHFCNRGNVQTIAGVKQTLGKRCLFPTADGFHALAPGEEAREKPLLLDPCHDRPELHLEFTWDGIVLEAESDEETALPKGRTSIPIYGLRRPDLVDARKARIIHLEACLAKAREYLALIQDYPDDPRFVDGYAKEYAALQSLGDPREPYSGMVLQLLGSPGGRLDPPARIRATAPAAMQPAAVG